MIYFIYENKIFYGHICIGQSWVTFVVELENFGQVTE